MTPPNRFTRRQVERHIELMERRNELLAERNEQFEQLLNSMDQLVIAEAKEAGYHTERNDDGHQEVV